MEYKAAKAIYVTVPLKHTPNQIYRIAREVLQSLHEDRKFTFLQADVVSIGTLETREGQSIEGVRYKVHFHLHHRDNVIAFPSRG